MDNLLSIGVCSLPLCVNAKSWMYLLSSLGNHSNKNHCDCKVRLSVST